MRALSRRESIITALRDRLLLSGGHEGVRRGSERGPMGLEKIQTEGRGEHDLDSFVILPQAQRQTLAARFISRTFFVETVKNASLFAAL